MCGIAGIYSFGKNTNQFTAYLNNCMHTMHHRGPDDNGTWTNERNYSAAFVRLSIRDVSLNGHQPMVSNCGKYVISFNGEIYNANSFVPQLLSKGVNFKSHSDTEILLYALIHFPLQEVLNSIDGMFSFAFYDNEKDELILARDKMGIKPLYIGYGEGYFIYSSQYDHIINVSFIKNNSINYTSLENYLKYGYLIAGEAIVHNTFTVPNGHYIIANKSGYTITKYYNFLPAHFENSKNDSEEIFRSSVQSQLVSDVPVGTFLSGGIDSPLINYWANASHKLDAFTIGNENKLYDESFYAKTYAKQMGLKHYYREIGENDFLNLINDNFKAFSEPFADFSSIPTMLVAKTAREHVTVILCGDGPDELFWGYDRNVNFTQKAALFSKSKLNLAFKKIKDNRSISKRYFTSPNLFSFYAQSLQLYGVEYWMNKVYKYSSAKNHFYLLPPGEYNAPVNLETSMQMVRWLEMNLHLQRILLKVDRSAMYYSVEARVPYLSNSVLNYAATLNYTDCIEGSNGKNNIKKIFRQKFNPQWADKKKQGFLVPMHEWINHTIKDDIYETLLNMPAELSDAFDKKQLKNLLDEHTQNGKHKDSDGFIWAIYSLAKWHSIHRKSGVLQ